MWGAEHMFKWSKVVYKMKSEYTDFCVHTWTLTKKKKESILMILSVRTSASTCHLALVTVQACSLLLEETFPSFDLWNPPGTQHEYLSCVTLIKLSQCCLKFGKMQHITVSRIFVSELCCLCWLAGTGCSALMGSLQRNGAQA